MIFKINFSLKISFFLKPSFILQTIISNSNGEYGVLDCTMKYLVTFSTKCQFLQFVVQSRHAECTQRSQFGS